MYKYISDLPISTTTLSIVISRVSSVFPLEPLGGNTTLKRKIEEELLEEEEGSGASVEEGIFTLLGLSITIWRAFCLLLLSQKSMLSFMLHTEGFDLPCLSHRCKGFSSSIYLQKID